MENPLDTRPSAPLEAAPARLRPTHAVLRDPSNIHVSAVHLRVAAAQIPPLPWAILERLRAVAPLIPLVLLASATSIPTWPRGALSLAPAFLPRLPRGSRLTRRRGGETETAITLVRPVVVWIISATAVV